MDKDNELINERWDDRNKWRGPGSPGVQLARGYILQALDLIEDDDVHLCADREALAEALSALEKAHNALSHNEEDVPGNSLESVDESKKKKKKSRSRKKPRGGGYYGTGDSHAGGNGGDD